MAHVQPSALTRLGCHPWSLLAESFPSGHIILVDHVIWHPHPVHSPTGSHRSHPLHPSAERLPQAWQQGGYSDDLILAAKCSEHRLAVAVPSCSIFPQWCAGAHRVWVRIARKFFQLHIPLC